MENSPIFKKYYNQFIETIKTGWEKEQTRGIEKMRKAQTECRIVFLVICLAILAVAAAEYLIMDNMEMNGAYCDYPDPYGR